MASGCGSIAAAPLAQFLLPLGQSARDARRKRADMPDHPPAANAGATQTPPTAESAEHARRHPDEWVTDDEPMTEAQAGLLRKLCREAGEPFESGLSKGAASQRIDALQTRAGREPSNGFLIDEQTDG
jgi:hypothetical protein